MYNWQCPNCGWSGEVTAEAQAAAVAEADKVQATHHIEHCPRCQWVVRIPIDLLRVAAVEPVVEKKPAMKKAAAKKATAKKVVKKPAAKKKVVKKPAAKKVVVKKSPAKKKPAAKKPAAKRKK